MLDAMVSNRRTLGYQREEFFYKINKDCKISCVHSVKKLMKQSNTYSENVSM